MVRRIPKESSKEHCKLSKEQEKRLWINLFSEKLRINKEEAKQRIDRNNSLLIIKIPDSSEDSVHIEPRHPNEIPPNCLRIYPRLNANTRLLAQLSKDYEGPRGPRPIYVSLENVVRISLLDEPTQMYHWLECLYREGYSVSEALIKLKLTTSNPSSAPRGVEFSSEDIRRGVYIPPSLDKETMQALGIIYAKGYVLKRLASKRLYSLRINRRMTDKEFYEAVVRKKMEKAFNLLQDENHKHSELKLSYGSKALVTYLLNRLTFPSSRNEKKETGISEEIKNNEYIEEFLKFYLAYNAAVRISGNGRRMNISINDVSKPILEDIKKILLGRIKKSSITISPSDRGSYRLNINIIPTFELYFSGLLNENPRIKGIIENYLKEHGIGRIAFNYLHSVYGESIAQYRRQN